MRLSRRAFQLGCCVILLTIVYFYCRLSGHGINHLTTVDLISSRGYSRIHSRWSDHSRQYVNRFILSLNYWEQFTMATSNLFSLICLGKMWNATTVKPFTFNSRLYGLQNFKPDDNFNQSRSAQTLDLIYDVNSLAQVLHRHNLPELADFKDFLKYSSKNVIVAHYISPRETHELTVMKGRTKKTIEQEFKKDSIVDCKNHLQNYLQMVEKALNSELQEFSPLNQFRVMKYWCINMSEFSTPQQSAAKMQFEGNDDVTIIIVNWRGMGSKQVIKNSVKGLHSNNRIAMVNTCRHFSGNRISYSQLVKKTSQLFAASLGITHGDTFAAVHIRSEKLGLREPRMPGVTKKCFEELMRKKNILAKEHPSLKFVFFTDYGPYSSDTCRNCRGSRDVRKYLYKRGIEPIHFEPSNFNVTFDSGFAAAVESQFLTSASHLFLCGGGGYQNQIATRFQDSTHKMTTASTIGLQRRIYRVCNSDSDIYKLLKDNS